MESFGKNHKPSSAIRLEARKYKVRLTTPRGFYRSESVIMREIAKLKSKSFCKGLNITECGGNPNCLYTSNGICRRRVGVSGKAVYEGPMGSPSSQEIYNKMYDFDDDYAPSQISYASSEAPSYTPSQSFNVKPPCPKKPSMSPPMVSMPAGSRPGFVGEMTAMWDNLLGKSSFGKRRKARKVRKVSKKPSKALLKMCKKYKIKVSIKRGGKRVYKSTAVLKKLLKRKMRKFK